MFFIPFQPQQKRDQCLLKFNPSIICGARLIQQPSSEVTFWFVDDADREVD